MSDIISQSLTADDLFFEMQRMPESERINFFTLLTCNAFRENDFSHEQVFGHLQHEPFSAAEAAEYLEVSLPTLRRHVQSGKLIPSTLLAATKCFLHKYFELSSAPRAKNAKPLKSIVITFR